MVQMLLGLGMGNVWAKTAESEDEPKQLYAQSAVLMDADNGRILFGKEAEVIRPNASTTKILTCILALESEAGERVICVSRNAASQPKVRLGMKEGEKFYLRDLLYSLMLESHNDSAVAIAEAVEGTVEKFADRMNQKAREIGCENTHFITPNGLDASDKDGIHGTTAADLAAIMRYCITQSPEKEHFLEITQTREYTFGDAEGKRKFFCRNHNAFLDMMDGVLSGKTGFTNDAGYCYVGALREKNRTLIVTLLACGWPNHKSYKWSDTRKLMEYGLLAYAPYYIWKDPGKMNILAENAVNEESPWKRTKKVKAAVREDSGFQMLLKEGEQVTVKKRIEENVKAPVTQGQVVGEMEYFLNGEKIASYQIEACESVKKRSFFWCLKCVMEWMCL